MNQSSVSESNSTQIEREIAECLAEIEDSSPSANIYCKLGNLYSRQQQWKQARQYYEAAIEVNPELAKAHYGLAEVFTNLGNNNSAADHRNLAFKFNLNLGTPRELYELAKTLAKQNKPNRAIAAYRRTIERKPNFVAAYRSLGKFLQQQKESAKAIDLYTQGVKKNPEHPQFHLLLGQAYAEEKKWEQALKSYQTVARLKPELAKVYYLWGEVLVQLEKNSEAEILYKKAISLQKSNWEAYYQLGLLWQKEKKWEQAIIAYKKVLGIKPKHQSVLHKMAIAYRAMQEYDLALTCHRKIIQNSADSSSIPAKTITEYQTTLAEYPQVTIQHYYRLAKLLRSKGFFSQAILAYQQTIEKDPYFTLAYIDLQYTPIAKPKLTQLIECYRQIVTKYPDITIAWGNLGDALSQQGRIPAAVECYQKASYQQAIQTYPYLAKLDWKAKQESGPDFIIAGASKSGTSSIYYYLGRHPQVLLSHKKEIDFYWRNYQHGIDWYLAHFPTITDSSDFMTGEATPNYLRFPEVARRIKRTFPKTKIIILLRNPADRAISWHYHKFNTGLTNQDLTTAIASEIERLETVTEEQITKTSFYNPDNILSSLYIYKIKPWIEILGREQFLILKSEDFYQDTAKTMKEVHQFLGLSDCTLTEYPTVNEGSYNEIDASLRKTLVKYFAPYNQKLEEYLGMKFNWE